MLLPVQENLSQGQQGCGAHLLSSLRRNICPLTHCGKVSEEEGRVSKLGLCSLAQVGACGEETQGLSDLLYTPCSHTLCAAAGNRLPPCCALYFAQGCAGNHQPDTALTKHTAVLCLTEKFLPAQQG